MITVTPAIPLATTVNDPLVDPGPAVGVCDIVGIADSDDGMMKEPVIVDISADPKELVGSISGGVGGATVQKKR